MHNQDIYTALLKIVVCTISSSLFCCTPCGCPCPAITVCKRQEKSPNCTIHHQNPKKKFPRTEEGAQPPPHTRPSLGRGTPTPQTPLPSAPQFSRLRRSTTLLT